MNRVSQPHRKIGFTILELLIAASLTSVLLVGAWSMFSILGRLHEKTQRQAEKGQLVRSLMHQLQTDLDAIVQRSVVRRDRSSDSPNEWEPPASELVASQSRQQNPADVQFVGTKHSMTFDVVRSPTVSHQPRSETPSNRGVAPVELARVTYTSRPDDTRGAGQDSAMELIRLVYPRLSALSGWMSDPEAIWELADRMERFENVRHTSASTRQSASDENHPRTTSRLTAEALAAPDSGKQLSDQNHVDGVELDNVPEIEWCAFRYFDGRQWLDRWDGSSGVPLPAAIELTIDFGEDAPGTSSAGRSGDKRRAPRGQDDRRQPMASAATRDDQVSDVRFVFFLADGVPPSGGQAVDTQFEVRHDEAT